MFVRLVLFNVGTGKRDVAQALADDLGPAIKSQHGCQNVTFFGDDEDGQYGIFVLWESQQDAEAAASVISPMLQRHLAGNVQGEPLRRLFQVVEPANGTGLPREEATSEERVR